MKKYPYKGNPAVKENIPKGSLLRTEKDRSCRSAVLHWSKQRTKDLLFLCKENLEGQQKRPGKVSEPWKNIRMDFTDLEMSERNVLMPRKRGSLHDFENCLAHRNFWHIAIKTKKLLYCAYLSSSWKIKFDFWEEKTIVGKMWKGCVLVFKKFKNRRAI
jgi:hypothetical protein